ncbi:MAG: response regulator [Burkholderiaceae bacterium]|nr:response regulator [Burkholderiaceae bacterium]
MTSLPPSRASRPLRVLVADDNVINTRTAARILREMGHGGVLVNDGEQVLKALAQKPFDLVLLDVNMPVMDGPATLKAIRAREAAGAAHQPVVFVTAHDLPSDRTRYLALGADGFLVKPLESAALLAELKRLGLA